VSDRERKPATKVVGKLCVRYSMRRVMMVIIEREENAAGTKYPTVCASHSHGRLSIAQILETQATLDMVTVPLAC